MENANNVVEDSSGVVSNSLVAVFTDPNAGDTASIYSATIGWGDGSSSAATSIVQNGNVFKVYGSHTYARAQVEPITVDVFWDDPVRSRSRVAQAAPQAGPAKVYNLSAILKANFVKWASNGKNLTLNDVNRLMDDHSIQGSDAAAVAVLKGFVLGLYGTKNERAASANLFVKDLTGWGRQARG